MESCRVEELENYKQLRNKKLSILWKTLGNLKYRWNILSQLQKRMASYTKQSNAYESGLLQSCISIQPNARPDI